MRSSEFVVLFVISLLVLSMMQTGSTTETFTQWIDPGEYETRLISSTSGKHLTGNFTVNKGDYINFFICNDGNLTIWLLEGEAYLYDYQENVTFHEFDFTTPNDSNWYLVFSNIDLNPVQRQLTGHVVAPRIDQSIPRVWLPLIASCTALIMFAAIVRYRYQ
jgi:hypothetical protein